MKKIIMVIASLIAMVMFSGCASDQAAFAKNKAITSSSMTVIAANTQLQAALGVRNAGAIGTTIYNQIAVDSGLPQTAQTEITILNLFAQGGNLAREMEHYGVCQVNPGAHKLTNVLLRGQSWGGRSSFYRVTMNGGTKTCVTQGDNVAFNSNNTPSHYRYCGNKISVAKIIRETSNGPTFAQVLAAANIKLGTPALSWWERAGLKIVPTFNVGVQYRINPDIINSNNVFDVKAAGGSATANSSSQSSASSSSSSTATGGAGGNANITKPTGCQGAGCQEQPDVPSNYGGPADSSSTVTSNYGGPDSYSEPSPSTSNYGNSGPDF